MVVGCILGSTSSARYFVDNLSSFPSDISYARTGAGSAPWYRTANPSSASMAREWISLAHQALTVATDELTFAGPT